MSLFSLFLLHFLSMMFTTSSPEVPEHEWAQRVRFNFIGTLLSAIIYGLLIALLRNLFSLLTFKRRPDHYNNRIRRILIVYVVTMFLLSTATIIQGIVYLTRIMFCKVSRQLVSMNEHFVLPVAIWGADGLMVG